MTVSHCLVAGFGLATRRLHMVLLDAVAMLLWLTGTVLLLWFGVIWFTSQVVLESTDLLALESGLLPLTLATIGRLLVSHLGTLGWTLFGVAVVSCLAWILLEAFVHAGTLAPGDRSFYRDAFGNFGLFLMSGLLRRAILSAAGVLIALIGFGPLLTASRGEWGQLCTDIRWPVLAGLIFLSLLAFFLTVLDTLIRSDAIEILGFQLPQALGVVGTIVLFEAFLVGSVAIGIATALALTAGTAELMGSVIITLLLVAGLTLVHSYLLLARYSSVAVMRRLVME